MREILKNAVMHLARIAARPLALLPMRSDRIVLSSHAGREYSCSPKYAYLALRERWPGRFTYVWGFEDPGRWSGLASGDTEICRYRSLRWTLLRMTSRVYITNDIEGTEIPRRHGQLKVQTWHGGGAYKHVLASESKLPGALLRRRLLNVSETDLFLSGCHAFTNLVLRDGMRYRGKVLEAGLPRNDLLVRGDTGEAGERVRRVLGIHEGAGIVLFAPTWRYEEDLATPLDWEAIANAFERRFGRKAFLLYRAHLLTPDGEAPHGVIDVSGYPDMQELLAAADLLVSDYSSCIWDFSLTGRPCMLFVPDLDDYDGERGFYTPISTWGFPVARSNEELAEAILGFDEDSYAGAIEQNHREFGSCETGHAGEALADLIAGLSKA